MRVSRELGAPEGFSLVEVVVAMLILTVGILTMAASTGYILSEVRMANFRSERNVAVGEVTQQLQGVEWDNLEGACGSAYTVDRYTVSCTVNQPGTNLKEAILVSVGPGYSAGAVDMEVADSTALLFARP